MSWRRKALTVGIVLGAGVVSIGPILSASIAKRIANSWNVQASVAKVEVSLPRAGLSLLGLRIERPDLCIQGNQVDLKLHRESLWYRDSVVESMVGKGFLFTITPTESDRPEESSSLTKNHFDKTNQSLNAFHAACREFETSIGNQLDSARRQIQESEQKCQSRALSIDERISHLHSEVAAFHDPARRPNPLRASQRLEQARSEVNHIQQLLAEERLQRKQWTKACESTMKSWSESIQALRQSILKPEVETSALVQESLRQAIADAEQELLPYTKLLHFAVESFLDSRIPSTSQPSRRNSSIDQDLVLAELRPRRSQILQCRISGSMEREGTREPVVIQMVNPNEGSLANCARLQMEWGATNAAQSPNTASGARTSGLAEKLSADPTSSSLRLSVERETAQNRIHLQHNVDGHRIQSKIILSSHWVSDRLPNLDDIAEAPLLPTPEEFIAIESETLPNGADTWDLPIDQLTPLVRWFDQQWERSIEERFSLAESAAKSRVSDEMDHMRRRNLAMEETMSQRQAEWSQQLQDLLKRMEDYEGEHLRVGVSPATMTR